MDVASKPYGRIAAWLVSVFTLAGATALPATAEFSVPPLRSAVNDNASMLSRGAEQRIEGALRALKKQGGTQLAVLTVENLGGLSIEQASIRVTDEWKLGSEREDSGVLLMIARDERKIRIEVGQGLEGALPDAYAKRIIDEAMTPLFRTGDIAAGITVGVFQIAKRTNPEIDLTAQLQGTSRMPHSSRRRSSPMSTLMFLLIMIPIALMRSGVFFGGGLHRRHGGYYWGASGYRGGGGFGGGGFGGFSGGGGGFSGGGASGGW